MIIFKKITMMIIFIFLGILIMVTVNAEEPKRPIVTEISDYEKQAKIMEVQRLQVDQAFERLKGNDFLIDNDLLTNAIFRSFQDQIENAVAYSLYNLRKPRREITNGKLVDRTLDLYVAKKILQMFPDDSLESLLIMYDHVDPSARANIIFALGEMEGDPAIRNLLLMALDDKTFFQDDEPEMEGKSLRVCDEAYNQLVLRYEIKNVLRTIGNVHTLKDRDYHIEVLKKMF